MKEWRAKAIDEIDRIFDWLLKADKWSKLANRLTTLMISQWTEAQQEAIYNAVSYLYKTPDALITEADVKLLVSSLERDLGKPLAEAMREPIAGAQGKAYAEAHKDVGLKFEMNRPDRKALDWLQKDSTYWIGSYYERELARSVQDAASKAIKDGMSWAQAGDHFKQVLGDRFSKTNVYWEGLANHVVTRSREFGHVSAYDKAGVEYLKVMALMDRRTTPICRHMNGRVIAVSRARQLRDDLMNAKTPEDTKKVAPWLTDKQVESKVVGTDTSALPLGLSLPPYHFNCRTRTVMAYADELPTAAK